MKKILLLPILFLFTSFTFASYRIPYNHPIKNQGRSNQCVAYSLSYCKEIIEERQSGEYREFSPAFIYADRLDTQYQGKYLKQEDALQNLEDFGVCENKDFYTDENEYPWILLDFNPIKQQLLEKAYPYRISSFKRIYTLDEYKQAILHGNMVTITILNFNNVTWDSKGVLELPNADSYSTGSHEVTGMGWTNKDEIIFINSYGYTWGDKGYGYIPKGFFSYCAMWEIEDNIMPTNVLPQGKGYKLYFGNYGKDALGLFYLTEQLKWLGYTPKVNEIVYHLRYGFVNDLKSYDDYRYYIIAREVNTLQEAETLRSNLMKQGIYMDILH